MQIIIQILLQVINLLIMKVSQLFGIRTHRTCKKQEVANAEYRYLLDIGIVYPKFPICIEYNYVLAFDININYTYLHTSINLCNLIPPNAL